MRSRPGAWGIRRPPSRRATRGRAPPACECAARTNWPPPAPPAPPAAAPDPGAVERSDRSIAAYTLARADGATHEAALRAAAVEYDRAGAPPPG